MVKYDDCSGALEAGDDAFGVTMERAGTGRTPGDDRLLALGYPHMYVPTDETIKWDKLDGIAKVVRKYDLDRAEYPRELIPWLVACRIDIDRSHKWQGVPARPPGPLAHDLDAVVAGMGKNDFINGRVLFALEAMHGSQAVAERAVAHVETWDDFGHHNGYARLLSALHFVLLRCHRDVRQALVDRLEAVFEAAQGGSGRAFKALDMALHGRTAVERWGYRPNQTDLIMRDLIFAIDDPAWVSKTSLDAIARLVPNDKPEADARVAFLAGDAVVQAICENVESFHSKGRKAYVAGMGRFAHPAVTDAITRLSELGGAKSQAKAWLKANTP